MDSSSSCCFNVEEEVIVIRNGWTPKKKYAVIYHIGSNMYKLKEQNPACKKFYAVFCKVQFSALHCLIYILMTFVIYQAFLPGGALVSAVVP